MLRTTGLLATAFLLLASPRLEARTTVQEEFQGLLWKIAHHVYNYYYEEVPADTLVQATARGVFSVLDPASEYAFSGDDTTLAATFYTLMQVTQSVSDSALYAVSPDTLIRAGVAGMMEVLDPYTVYMETRNLDNFNIQTQGHYGGLGFRIQVVYPDSAIAVWQLLHEDTPAARAGVRAGDLIVAIGDSSTRHMSAADAADLMRGQPGTPVTLTLRRAGRSEPIRVTIAREEIQMRSVPYYTLLPDSVGYVKLTRFQSKSSAEVREAIETLQRQGMKSLVLDLRGNGGGYLQEAVQVADLLLPRERLVVFTAGRAFRDTSRYVTEQEAVARDEPLVVLVDHASASASEIVAGAVQDWDRGLILGTPTVGKGSVQQTIAIGDRAELKLTMAAWHTPSGRSIDKRMRKDSTVVADNDQIYRTLVLGRKVRGGGGITPDVYETGRKASPLFNQLMGYYSGNPQFFYFSRQYHLSHPGLTSSFQATPQTLQEFRRFVEARAFEYVSDVEAPLKEVEEKLKEDSSYGQLQRHVDRLISEIGEVEETHWAENAALLQWKLTNDILDKNFGPNAALAYNVTVDPQVARARQILTHPTEYNEWLRRPEIGVQVETVAHEVVPEDVQ
ncbi:MAG: S41 family peptidase [Candidatus Latescibacterota bacterium]